MFTRTPHLLLITLVSALLAACGTQQTPQNALSESADEISASVFASSTLKRAVNLTHVPFFPQENYQCGPAALATILGAEGLDIVPEALVDQVYLPEKQATLPLEMVAAGRRQGLLAYPLPKEFGAILNQLDAGYPVLVFQNLGLEVLEQWHFAVAVGYDLDKRELILRSATTREYRVDFKTFLNTWQRADRWAYIFIAPGKLPAQPVEKTYLESSLDLADQGLTISAQKALETGIQEWPESDLIRLALSNTYFQSGLFDDASDILLASPNLKTNGALWNNIAYIQLARQCYQSAFQAVQCAITLTPDDANIRASLSEILPKSSRPNGPQSCPTLECPVPVKGF